MGSIADADPDLPDLPALVATALSDVGAYVTRREYLDTHAVELLRSGSLPADEGERDLRRWCAAGRALDRLIEALDATGGAWPDLYLLREYIMGGSPYLSYALWPRVRDRLMVQDAAALTTPEAERHRPADGVHDERWLVWQGRSLAITPGSAKLLGHMWERSSASYEELHVEVFDAVVEPGSIRSAVSKANQDLAEVGSTRRLIPGGRNRRVAWDNSSATERQQFGDGKTTV